MSIKLNQEYDFSQSEHLAQEVESTPHIRDRRITVRDIGALVHKRKLAPATIADRFELPEAAVHEALAFYHLNPEYFTQLNQSRQRHHDDAITPDDVAPDEPLNPADLGVENLSVTFDDEDDGSEPESDSTEA
jgi:uncharacterized protein (DUF433 family)